MVEWNKPFPCLPPGEPGGEEFDEVAYTKAALRADLCEIINKHSFPHGTRIVDEILKRYNVTRKKL